MRDVQRIVIVDPSDATREPLRNLLLGVESVWLEAECSRYEFFFDVVNQSKPDVAVVALDADQNKALQLISQLSQDHPDLPILAVSGQGDGQSILQALRSGAKEFLTQPVVLEELLLALQRLQQKRVTRDGTSTNGAVKPESLMIAIVGSRGGVLETRPEVSDGSE
jgi:pilus assembly protein CpaE